MRLNRKLVKAMKRLGFSYERQDGWGILDTKETNLRYILVGEDRFLGIPLEDIPLFLASRELLSVLAGTSTDSRWLKHIAVPLLTARLGAGV